MSDYFLSLTTILAIECPFFCDDQLYNIENEENV